MGQVTLSENLLSKLIDIGLSENQARAYLASRQIGPSKASFIARAAGLKRTTVYPVIEALERLGLMRTEIKGFKKLYYAEHPERLNSLVEMRRAEFQKSLPELKALGSTVTHKSNISFYDSLDGIHNAYNSMIADVLPKQDYLIFSSAQDVFNIDPDFFEDFFRRRAKLDINIRAIVSDDKMGQRYLKYGKDLYNVETKLLPGRTKMESNLVISPQKVLIHQLTVPTWLVLIESPQVVKSHQQLFYTFWSSLPNVAQ